jgi:hypothetical protein
MKQRRTVGRKVVFKVWGEFGLRSVLHRPKVIGGVVRTKGLVGNLVVGYVIVSNWIVGYVIVGNWVTGYDRWVMVLTVSCPTC